MASEIVGLLKDWGLGGVLGVGGCYLVVGSIAGRIIRIGNVVPEVELQTNKQRALLALFGCVLAVPIIWSAYGQTVFGTPGKLAGPPAVREVVDGQSAPAKKTEATPSANAIQLASLAMGPGTASSLMMQEESCRVVESFGIEQQEIRELKSERFRGEVLVYVGEVHSVAGKSTNVYIVTGGGAALPRSGKIDEADFQKQLAGIADKNKIVLSISRAGETGFFGRYRLTVTEIYAVLLGADAVAIEICEMP